MRFKSLHKLTIIMAGCLLIVALTGKLTLYIHPRYITFTTLSVAVGFMLLLVGLYCSSTKQLNKRYGSLLSTMPLIIVTLCAVVLAPSSLSQSLASSRSSISQQNNLYQTAHSTIDSFSNDLTRFSIADWNNLLASAPSADTIENKKAMIEGFLYNNDDNQLYVARFRLTCCAVDATPLAIPLIQTDTFADLELGSWVAIEGVFKSTSDEQHPWQLEVSSISQIEEPDDPYIF